MFSLHQVMSVRDAHLAKGDRDLVGSSLPYRLFKKSEELLVAFLIVRDVVTSRRGSYTARTVLLQPSFITQLIFNIGLTMERRRAGNAMRKARITVIMGSRLSLVRASVSL